MFKLAFLPLEEQAYSSKHFLEKTLFFNRKPLLKISLWHEKLYRNLIFPSFSRTRVKSVSNGTGVSHQVWQDHSRNESSLLTTPSARPVCPRRTFWVPTSSLSFRILGGARSGTCHGQVRREICNLDLYDLARLRDVKQPPEDAQCLFVNKFDLRVSPGAVACWKEDVLYRAKS